LVFHARGEARQRRFARDDDSSVVVGVETFLREDDRIGVDGDVLDLVFSESVSEQTQRIHALNIYSGGSKTARARVCACDVGFVWYLLRVVVDGDALRRAP